VPLKRVVGILGTLTILLASYHVANDFLVARDISPPRATTASILRLMIHSRFQMATPHRSLFTRIRLELIPTAEACGTPDCDGTEAKADCGSCLPGFCYCPGCQSSGCTVYTCQETGNNSRKCTEALNKDTINCPYCEDDYNVRCNPIPP
jgi:hypothetical protein